MFDKGNRLFICSLYFGFQYLILGKFKQYLKYSVFFRINFHFIKTVEENTIIHDYSDYPISTNYYFSSIIVQTIGCDCGPIL